MSDETNSNAQVAGQVLNEIFCPHCAGKLSGVVNGKRDKCAYDDCGKSFVIRIP